MINNLGYNKSLFILPFDHRSTFEKGMFGVEKSELLNDEQRQVIREEKEIIYEGFKKAVREKIPKEFAAILVDEEFGDSILRDAAGLGFVTLLTTEKSGEREFTFEYGDNFGEHIKKYSPTFAKALIHFNPENDPVSKEKQLRELRKLNDFCHSGNFKFMLEVLIEASESQLLSVDGDKNRYDQEVRPKLAVEIIRELQEKGVDPDVWKMEGLAREQDYKALVDEARTGGRDNVGIVVLGRGAEKEEVEKWISSGAKVEGVIGFAVGRTIFWDDIVSFKDGKTTREEAINRISKNYQHFYNLFMEGRRKA